MKLDVKEEISRRRFWVPRDGSVNLADGGFLVDPDSEWAANTNQDAVPFESIAANPCLCLLGEPGIGKSTALSTEYDRVRSACLAPDQAAFFDLRAYSSDQRLCEAIFKSPTWLEWLSGTHRLDLFLDSLDECLIRVDNIAAVLLEALQKAPVDRLYVRIACRTADWQNTLETGLRDKYGKLPVKVYELAPLRRIDVVAEAEAFHLDPASFLKEVNAREAVPFAIKPITLKFLLRTYSLTKKFPPTRAGLYEEGCRCLSEETSVARRDAGKKGNLTANQRMAIASRIAAVTIFGNHYAIWTAANVGDHPAEDIVVDGLAGGTEVAPDGMPANVTIEALDEVLDTGLFSSRGMNRLGWSHQTYSEFLAARYLARANISIDQMLAIVMHPGDPKKVVPQLHETVAWLAGIKPEVFRAIAKSDPEVLLRSDVAMAHTADRRALVKHLLASYEEGRLVDSNLDLRLAYGKLGYPEIGSDLQTYIVDRVKGVIVRRVAIDIAEANHVVSLQDDLVNVALDAFDFHDVRVQAAYAIGKIGEPAAKARLKPLALHPLPEDPDDELKACGLLATWPQYMTAAELFPGLTLQKKSNVIGLYYRFLRNHVVAHLQPADLPIGLEWAKSHVSEMSAPGPMCDVVEALILKALDHLDSANVLERLAELVRERLRIEGSINPTHQRGSVSAKLMQGTDQRRKLLKALLEHYNSDDADFFRLSRVGLIAAGDLSWLVRELDDSCSPATQKKLSKLIAWSINGNDVEDFDAVLAAAHRNKYLGIELEWLLTPVELGSPRAAEMKEWYSQSQAHQSGDETILTPPPSVRIANRLNEFESGDADAFTRLLNEMSLKPNGMHDTDWIDADLTVLPGWQSADEVTKGRIVNAATRYLVDYGLEPHAWLGSGSIPYSAIAGYRALAFLLNVEPASLDAMSTVVWEKCASIVLAFPLNQRNDEDRRLAKINYQRAPGAVTEALRLLARAENSRYGTISVLTGIDAIWDLPLESALLAMTDEDLTVASLSAILEVLLKHGSQRAIQLARTWVDARSSGGDRAKAVVAATKLVCFAAVAAWDVVWAGVRNDAAFGIEVFSGAAGDRAVRGINHLTDAQLGELFVWLVRNVPYEGENQVSGVVGSRERLQRWRDGILGRLKSRGTDAACHQIRGIIREFPQHTLLKYSLLEAEATTRTKSWVPLSTQDILRIVGDSEVRLVRNGQHLLAVLIESLHRLQVKLQGETPAADDLWNGVTKSKFRPKDEVQLSDYIKRHFEHDIKDKGIIASREVQIRRGTGGAPGELTDIHVNAIAAGGFDIVTVVVEVKGAWNQGLFGDMKGQLVDRYLKDNPCRHGLYVVGWFNCNQWDDADYRKGLPVNFSIDQLKERLNIQALELSVAGLSIRAEVLNAALR